MRIETVATGADFELYVEQIFRKLGTPISTTPTTNDYGADLVFNYKERIFVVQCKYYSNTVGIKAIQEINGAIKYYHADYAIVVTNSTFTQQAITLAKSNNVLLVNGVELNSLQSKGEIDLLLNKHMGQNTSNHQNQTNPSDWVMNDLIVRYSVSSQKILKDFLGKGLPYFKVGREYHFNPSEVRKWEIEIQSIPYGKNEEIILPAFSVYKTKKLQELKDAKRAGDKKQIKAIKQELKEHGISKTNVVYIIILVVILFLIIFISWLFISGKI